MNFELLSSILEVREISSKASVSEIKSRLARYYPDIHVFEKNNRATLTGKNWKVELSMQLKHAFDVSIYKQKGLFYKELVLANSKFTDGINETVQFILTTLKGE